MSPSAESHATLDPNALDVTREDQSFAAYHHGRPLTTPRGRPIRHESQRLVEHLARELALTGRWSLGEVNAYTWFAWTLDSGDSDLEAPLAQALAGDHFTNNRRDSSSAGQPTPAAGPGLAGSPLDLDHPHFTLLFGGLNGLVGRIIETIMELADEADGLNFDDLLQSPRIFRRAWTGLQRGRQAALLMLSQVHDSGFILPFLAVDGRITPSEYANGVFLAHAPFRLEKHAPSETVTGPWPAMLTTRPDWQAPAESYAVIRQQVATILELLTYLPKAGDQGGLQARIGRGEDFSQEFKSTLRRNLYTKKNDPAIEHASLKTIAAFLNSSGGTLLIGVRDDGSLEGIESDGFASEDAFSLHLWNLIKSSLGLEVTRWIQTSFEKSGNLAVCLVRCAPSPEPVFLHMKADEEFYIRVGPSSARLGVKEALKYIAQRFRE